jgi:hypothetical protein
MTRGAFRTLAPSGLRVSHSGMTLISSAGLQINRILRLQRLVEVVDGALPGEFSGAFVKTRRGIVVEAMIRFRIHIRLVLDVIRLEGGFVLGPPAVDAGILLGKVKQQSGLDLRHILDSRCLTLEGNPGSKLRQPNSEPVHHAAADAEADSPELAGGLRML